MPLPYDLYIFAFIIVAFASFIQSLAGIGLALVAAPILVIIDARFLPGPILTLGCCLSLLMSLRHRKSIQLGRTAIALYGRIPGSLLGIVLLSLIPQSLISLGFALLIILSVAISYHHIKVAPTNENLLIAGFFSGLMGTTTSIGGPPIALVYQNSREEIVRAQLGFYFLIGTSLSIIMLLISGNYSLKQIELTLPLIPATLVGFKLSEIFCNSMNSAQIKLYIAFISISSCLVIIYREILSF
ncbi:sulfite exporter TauE/SafE family protein [Neptuniibacter caesariensis]|uniref:Probable membrane transporter protein n=1 Tax=Neptuniibacter caesariensis TaxID=207954 RepID=A0A7U8C5F1_NEPCE|nr:sulfite exporter TauE/SafE family protein [Neptuniibacter caesariensis]EAR60201.1 putative membrane protein [Oceanospirillum sp. MED92] [Neptuniibacter caesariensis]